MSVMNGAGTFLDLGFFLFVTAVPYNLLTWIVRQDSTVPRRRYPLL